MKTIPFSIFAFAAIALTAVPVSAEDTYAGKSIDDLTPEEILGLVRYSYTLHDREFEARLRKDFSSIPFQLSLKPKYIRFRFTDPPQAIHLDTSGDDLQLREVVKGSSGPIAQDRYDDFIRDTDITYEDLAMRFLYWPNPKVLDHEKIKTRDAWKLQVTNPDRRGPYGHVLVWIDKASGGLLKMEGYDRQGNLVKVFEVSNGRKVGDVWIADVIRIRSFDPDAGFGQKKGTTWLEILEMKS